MRQHHLGSTYLAGTTEQHWRGNLHASQQTSGQCLMFEKSPGGIPEERKHFFVLQAAEMCDYKLEQAGVGWIEWSAFDMLAQPRVE